MRFAEKLRELRTAAGLSEAKLAEKAGLSFGAVHNYGLGHRLPTLAAAVKLARALGVTCETFADCDDIREEATAPPPSDAEPPRPRGRPPKATTTVGQSPEPEPKPSGQKKAPQAAQEPASGADGRVKP